MKVIELQGYGYSEVELIKGCIAGNRDCQEYLYNTYSPKFFAVCLRYAGDYHAAEDILQEGFIKLFNNIDKYRFEGSFEGWMKRIFINTAIEQIRRKKYFSEIEEDNGVVLLDSSVSGLERLKVEDLLKLVRNLPVGYRTIFNLFAIEGFGHKEISEQLQITEGTSKSQLARARAYLQKQVKKH